ncbi:hypothetical protein AURANDRAFT_68270 [Aureococcus anophagefferens]|uniref:Uncharacterized protein n=1 Tax=Aureococcus anophagefferens TaxID=44056 RepID=F0YP25_AURAN|nr:hypothetical protein AURANDRAFT_68270 [Aureococcus anophagefferens]EGB03135.1 hypothetical protein AURANDRAFT_68270 [Aureococcus anophagefferens]|eukprot:XP_009042170.1 hypothetical protein AURANDRAFT_68270 [Aureococcus anophagefferens]
MPRLPPENARCNLRLSHDTDALIGHWYSDVKIDRLRVLGLGFQSLLTLERLPVTIGEIRQTVLMTRRQVEVAAKLRPNCQKSACRVLDRERYESAKLLVEGCFQMLQHVPGPVLPYHTRALEAVVTPSKLSKYVP